MSQECVSSSSATIYYRANGATEYEKFYTENCPVDVQVSQGGGGAYWDANWKVSITVSGLLTIYGVSDSETETFLYWVVIPVPTNTWDNFYRTTGAPPVVSLHSEYEELWASIAYDYPDTVYNPETDSYVYSTSGTHVEYDIANATYQDPRKPERIAWNQRHTGVGTGQLSFSITPVGGSNSLTITDSLGAIFTRDFADEFEWYAACDCEDGCLPVYGDDASDEFICICADEDNEDMEKMKERIKQELLAELPPIIKSQLEAELLPKVEQKLDELPDKEEFKGKVVEFVKTALMADEAFKSAIKDTVKTALLSDVEFKSAMSDATKDRFTSDQQYQKVWIEIINTALKAKQDGDANGYPMDVLGVEVRVKEEANVPKSLSFAASASLTSSALEDALSSKYGAIWHTSGYTTATGKTTAQITPA